MKNNKKDFKITVIVPVYNVEDYIEETIESVINQTIGFEENIELILINDGSPDNSERICLKYKKEYPDNIVYIKQKNSGVSVARNNALKAARGKYVNFLDSDDKWDLDAFEHAIKFLDNHNEVDFCCMRVRHFDAFDRLHITDFKFDEGTRVVNTLEEPNNVLTMAAPLIYRREAIKNHRFERDLKFAEDMFFTNNLLLKNPKYGLVKEAFYYYRKRSDKSSMVNTSAKNPLYYEALEKAYIKLLKNSIDVYGEVKEYFQYLIMYDLQWRLKTGVKADFSDYEKEKYIDNIKYLLGHVNDRIIFEQISITYEYKLLSYLLKYGDKINDLIEIKNDEIFINGFSIGGFDSLLNGITELEVRKKSLFLIGSVTFIGDFKLYYKTNNKFVKIKTYVREDLNKDFGLHLNRLGYSLFIDLDKKDKIEFYLEFKGKKYKMTNRNYYYSRLNGIKNGYYYKNKYLITRNKNKTALLYEYKPSVFKLIGKELMYLLRILARRRFKIAVTRMIYWITKPFYRKEIWLFNDREFMAGDSGEIMFKYFNEHNKNKNIKSYFVVDKRYEDYKRMKQYGRVVSYHTMKYKLLFLNSKFIISSHADNYINNPFGKKRFYYINLFNFNFIYLTHGILLHDASNWTNRVHKDFSLYVVSSPMEYKSMINGPYYFKNNELIKTGMPRSDNLMNMKVKEENKILFMPSWRSTLAGPVIKGTQRREYNPDFKESEYYLFYNKLLNDEKLLSLLREKDLKIKFCIHPSFRSQIEDFVGNDRVEFDIDVNSQYETLSSKCLITDYSSAACDFAYVDKPVIYANFDLDHIYDVHYYNEGYFDYDRDGFGPNCKNYDETLKEIIKTINNNFKVEDKYKKRMDKFFYNKDNKNSERVYKEILKFDKENNI